MRKMSQKNSRGFTIIETMITIAIFIIVVMVGMGSLMNATAVHRKSNDQRSIMDNLNFIMEDMSRNIRTGYNMRCLTTPDNSSDPKSCPQTSSGGGGQVLVFESSEGDKNVPTDQWIYHIINDGSGKYDVKKSTDGGSTYSLLNPTNIKFSSSSGFFISGAETPVSGDMQEPLITIRLNGEILGKDNVSTPFSLQTTVSQRLIDSKI